MKNQPKSRLSVVSPLLTLLFSRSKAWVLRPFCATFYTKGQRCGDEGQKGQNAHRGVAESLAPEFREGKADAGRIRGAARRAAQDPGAGDVRASLNLPAAALELVSGHLGCSDSASIRRLAVHYARLPLPAPAPRKAKGKGKVSGPTLDEVLKPIREEIARLKAQNVTKPVPQTEEGYVIGPQGRPVLKRLAASSAEASRIVVQRLQGQFSRKRTTDYFVAGS